MNQTGYAPIKFEGMVTERNTNTIARKAGFSIGLFVYSVFFICEKFFTLLDNTYPQLVYIRYGVVVVGFCYVLLIKPTRLHYLYFVFIGWMIFVAFFRGNPLKDSHFFEIVRHMSLSFMLYYYIQKGQVKRFVNSFFVACVFCMLLNFVIDPRTYGLYQDVYDSTFEYYGRTAWFTCTRNTFAEYFLLSSLVFMCVENKNNSRRHIIGCLWVSFGLSFVIYLWSATGIFVMFLALVGILFIKYFKLSLWRSVIIALLCDLLIVGLRIQKIFSPIITSIFHRDITFTGRTYIWDYDYALISRHFITGSGSFSNYVPRLHATYHAHNVVLSILDSYGIIGFLLMSVILVTALRKTDIYKNFRPSKIISLFFFLFLIRGIFESPFAVFFVYLMLAYCLPVITGVEKPKKGEASKVQSLRFRVRFLTEKRGKTNGWRNN
jgi:O-antigen ligase